jgi:transcriptional regulator with XRE-family HTH domain
MAVNFPTMGTVREESEKIDGEKLRRLRRAAFMSRTELGAKSGLHPDYIGRLERGDWQGGSRLDNIRKLAEALGVEPVEILED